MAALAISSLAVRSSAAIGIIVNIRLFGCGLVFDESFARTHDREADELLGDFDFSRLLPRDGEGRGRKFAGVGEIRAEMRTAAVLPRAGGERNHAAGLDEGTQVEPIVPSQVELPAIARHTR